ncbi:MAG: hypothetical protein ACE5LC_03580 [Candidatus Aminicenantales bacterium]
MPRAVQRNYRIFDFSFSIAARSSRPLRLFDIVYRNFREKDDYQPGLRYEVVSSKTRRKALFLKSEERVFPFHHFRSEESQLFKLLTDELYRKVSSHFLIHGGGVCSQGKGVIVSGESGTGKSSLVVKLLAHGFEFLSDEIVPVNKKTGMMECFPRSVGLRREVQPWLKSGLDLFGKEEFDFSTGHKYFLNPLQLEPEKRGEPCPPAYFLYLARPRSGPEEKIVVHLVIESSGQAFVNSLDKLEEVKIIGYRKKANQIYLKVEVSRKASVLKEYLDLYRKYRENIIHSERSKEGEVSFSQEPEIVPLPLNEMSLLILKQLKEETVISRLRENKFRTSGAYWLSLVETMNLAKVKGYKIHVGRIEETTGFIQSLFT